MVLEATIICMDNSEWAQNGDYSLSRLQAQVDTVHLISGAKAQSNPKNTVRILTIAGKEVRVMSTPTSNFAGSLVRRGKAELKMSTSTGNLAGSPERRGKTELEAIEKKLKKSTVAIHIVSFGDEYMGKHEKISALVAAANNNDNSHIVDIRRPSFR